MRLSTLVMSGLLCASTASAAALVAGAAADPANGQPGTFYADQTATEFTTQLTGDEDKDDEYIDADVRQDDDSYLFTKDSTITYQNSSPSRSGAIYAKKNLTIDASGHILTIKTGGEEERVTEAAGIRLAPTKIANIKAGTLRLFVNDENSAASLKKAYGIQGDKGTLNITGMTEMEVSGTEVSHGVHAYQDDKMTLDGLRAKVNTSAENSAALYVGYTGRISVNVRDGAAGSNVVRLDGNVVSQDAQSHIDVALTGPTSYLKGLAFGNGTLNMWLQNGAAWHNVNQGAALPKSYWGSRITSLTGGASPERAGLIFQNEANTIAVDQYSGYTRVFYKHDAAAPKKLVGGALLINHAAAGSGVTMVTDNAGLNTDSTAAADVKLVDETLGALANKLWYRAYKDGERNLTGKVEIAEGLTATSASKRIENMTFDAASGKGIYGTPPSTEQTKTAFTTGLTGEATRDAEYTEAGVRQEDGSFVFTKDSKITAGETEIKAGAWLTTFSAAVSNSDIKTPVNIDLKGHNLTVNTKTDISTVGITAIGNGAQLNINNAGAITVNAENTGGAQTAAVYANSGGKVHIKNGGGDLESKILKVRANNVSTKTNVAVIKTMNGVPGAESNITIDGLVDVLAEGNKEKNSGANEAVSAVASTIDIGGGKIITRGDTWAAIRAYGEFVTQNTGVVNFNVKKNASGMAIDAGTNRAVIEGDFSTNGGMGTKGRISVGLSTAESYWLGNYVDTHGYGVTQGQYGSVNLFMKNGSYWKGFASGVMNVEMAGANTKWIGFNIEDNMKLTLNDGATWYNAITPEQKGWKDVAAISRVKHFSGNGGFIDMTGTNRFLGLGDSLDQTGVPGAAVQGKCSAIIEKGLGETGNLEIEEFSGNTTMRYRHDTASPTTVYGGTTTIKKATAGSSITMLTDSAGLNTESQKASDVNLVSATLDALAKKLYYTAYTTNERNLTGKATIAEGLTASSASKRVENITFDEATGQGGYQYTPAQDPNAQTQTEFTSSITNDATHDAPYTAAFVRKGDGDYVFTKDTVIRTNDSDKVIGGPWTPPNAPAISNVNPDRPLNIDMNGKKLTIETRGEGTVVGISAVGKGSKVNVKNAGAITIRGTNTGSLYSPTLFANGGGSIHIQNGGENLEDKVLTLRSVGKKEASPAVIKTMNGVAGAESNITIDGLVDLLADGTYPDGKGANEGVSAVASRVDIGGGSIRATGNAWAAIRAYGEFASDNYGTVNFNVTKGADGLANGAGKNRAILEGDIVTNGGMGTKGRVSVGLSTPESHWIGNYADTSGYGVTQGQLGAVNLFMKNGSYWKGFSNGCMKVEMSGVGTHWTGFNVGNNMQLKLAGGAVWHNAITPEQTDQDKKPAISRVKYFTGEGGFIDMTGVNRFLASSKSLSGSPVQTESSSAITEKGLGETGDLTIESYSGSTKVLYRHDENKPTTIYGGKITIKKAAENSNITLTTDNAGLNTESQKAADVNLASAALDALAKKLYYTAYTTSERNLTGKVEIAEGLTTSSASKRLENITFDAATGQGGYAYTPKESTDPITESETLTYDRQAIATKDAAYKVALYAGKSEYNHTNPMVVDMNGHSLYLEANSTQRGPIALAAYDSAGIRIVNSGAKRMLTLKSTNTSTDLNSGAWGIYAPGQLQIDAPVTIEEVRSKGVHAFGVATNGEDGSAPRVTFNNDLTIKSLVSEYVDPDHQWDDGRYLAAISAAKNAHITVKGNADIQNVKGSILRVTGEGGIIDISGGTLSTAEDADHTKQYYLVQAKTGTVRLNSPDGNVGNKKMNISGDMKVMREYGKSDSAQLTPFDSKGTVVAALTTADSDWTGAVTYDVDRVDSQQHPGAFTAHEAGQVDLTLQNGATWTNMLKSGASASWQGSRLTHLTGGSSAENAGMIFQKNDKDITVDNYSGHTRVFYRHDAATPTTMTGGDFRIKNAAENSSVTLTTDNAGLNTESNAAADVNLVSAALDALAKKLYYTAYASGEQNLLGKVEIAEGLTSSAASKRIENITFDATTGQGGYAYTPQSEGQTTAEFTKRLFGTTDQEYVDAHVKQADGTYRFTKDSTITYQNKTDMNMGAVKPNADVVIDAKDRTLTVKSGSGRDSAKESAAIWNDGKKLDVTAGTLRLLVNDSVSQHPLATASGIRTTGKGATTIKGMTEIDVGGTKVSKAVYAMGGTVTLDGLTAKTNAAAEDAAALYAQNDGHISVNIDHNNAGMGTVTLDGHIVAKDAASRVDAAIYGKSSHLKGFVYGDGTTNLYLQNGGVWENEKRGANVPTGFTGSHVKQLTGGGSEDGAGVIFQKDDRKITIDKYHGYTKVFFAHDAASPTTIKGGDIVIKKAVGGSRITLVTDHAGLNTSATAGMAEKNLVNATLDALAKKLWYTGYVTNERLLAGKVQIAEGLTASSASKRLEDITFEAATGRGGYTYTPLIPPPPSQTQSDFTTAINGEEVHDTVYANAGVRKSDGRYIFTKDSTITTGKDMIAAGAWMSNISAAISSANKGTLDIDLSGKNLTVKTKTDVSTTGISAIGKNSKVNVKNAGAISIDAESTNYGQTAALFVNGGGAIHIANGGGNLEDKVLKVRANGNYKTNVAVIKSMNGVTGVESNITIDGLVDVLADGNDKVNGKGANEAVSAVASTINIGGGTIKAINGAWAAIRAYGEFVSQNYGTVNFNVTKGADGLANGAGTNRAVIEGDIVTNGGMGTKGRVSVGLSTADSHWIGNYADTRGYGVTPGQLGAVNLFMKNGSYWKGFSNGSMKVEMSGAGTHWTGFNVGDNLQLKLADGAIWHNAITPEQKDQDNKGAISRVKYFSGEGGFIDMTGENRFLASSNSLSGAPVQTGSSAIEEKGLGETGNLEIEEFSGSTKVLYRHDAASPTTVYGGTTTIKKATAGSAVTLSTDSVGLNTESKKAADVNLVSATLDALAKKLYYTAYTTNERNLTGKAEIAEGLTTSSASKRLENITFDKSSGQGSYAYTPATDPKPPTPQPDPKPPTPQPDPKPPTPQPDPKPPTPQPDPKPPTPQPDPKPTPDPKPPTPKPTPDPKPNPKIEYGDYETKLMSGVKSAMMTSTMAWRAEANDLMKRMGDLRLSPQDAGIWARVYRGKTTSNKDNANFRMNYSTIQVGYDKQVNKDWRVGIAGSYMSGNSSYAAGNGKNKEGNLGIYGTWSGKDGAYVDLIAKIGRLQNEYTVYNDYGHYVKGDFKTWGGSLSAEYGKRISMQGGSFVEPQVELIYSHMNGVDYTGDTDYSGMKMYVHQKPYDSFIGRLGIGVGKETERSTCYARVSLYHEFAGDFRTEYSDGSSPWKTTQVGGSDTWVGVQLGGTLMLNDRTNLYGNFEKTFGGDIKTAWRVDAGMRWNF
ncbi:hypothetical protein AXF19_01985 [Selenomonas sp. oral taxon 126]|uniref:autotransporter outer membrane beta-barrel domain-containing protein n=1 Tax=Selenomonas sp. oral taxon 126 TaxID=712528 RepID=UPI00080797AC|nr:autotransporter outer membrane beta-barrel domain-containing protein [Selenomonas sp. oral taxon 126]ANR69883.1 hypothetical protein AXF19_01985 [Selenomonas sp. oral taxon 126]